MRHSRTANICRVSKTPDIQPKAGVLSHPLTEAGEDKVAKRLRPSVFSQNGNGTNTTVKDTSHQPGSTSRAKLTPSHVLQCRRRRNTTQTQQNAPQQNDDPYVPTTESYPGSSRVARVPWAQSNPGRTAVDGVPRGVNRPYRPIDRGHNVQKMRKLAGTKHPISSRTRIASPFTTLAPQKNQHPPASAQSSTECNTSKQRDENKTTRPSMQNHGGNAAQANLEAGQDDAHHQTAKKTTGRIAVPAGRHRRPTQGASSMPPRASATEDQWRGKHQVQLSSDGVAESQKTHLGS